MTAALALLRRFWPLLVGAGLLLTLRLYIGHVERAAKAEQFTADKIVLDQLTADIAAKTQAAQLADIAHARAIETAQAEITRKTNDDMQSQLASARQRLAAYVLQHPASRAGKGGGGAAHLSGAPDRANVADSASAYSVVSVGDLDICTENTVRLTNAANWLRDQQKMAQ